MTTARIYFHPTLLARRAAEIAAREKDSLARLRNPARLGRDACGRPFVLGPYPPAAANDERGPPPTLPPSAQGRRSLDRLIRALLEWLPPTEAPGRVYREGER